MLARIGRFMSHGGRAFDWYVDSVRGNDANAGTAPNAALRTIAALMEKPLMPGQRIGLARGSHWREQLGINVDGVQVVAYGTGEKPLLDASDVISPAAWSKTAGYTNVYEAALPVFQMQTQTFPGVWEDDQRMIYKTSAADVDATPGSYCPVGIGATPPSPMTFYVHPSDSGNPASNGKTYEYSRREAGLRTHGSGFRIYGIHTRRNCATPGSLLIGKHSFAQDCLASDGSFHSVYVEAGSRLKNVEARNAYHYDQLTMFVYYDDAAAGEDNTFEDCYAHIDGPMPGDMAQSPAGFFGHSGTGTYGTITLRNCRTSGLNSGISIGAAARCVLDGCRVEGAQWPYSVGCPDSRLLNCAADGGKQSRVIAAAQNVAAYVRGFEMLNSPGPNSHAGFYSTDADTSLDIADSLTGPIVLSGARARLICRNVTFKDTAYYYVDLNAADAEEADSDYNHFDANGNGFFRFRGVEYSYANWKATGRDTHSTP